jgi:hypothetical protein
MKSGERSLIDVAINRRLSLRNVAMDIELSRDPGIFRPIEGLAPA